MAEYEVNFPQIQEGVRNLSWPELRKMVEPDKGTRKNRDPYNLANLEMARRVVDNYERVVNYYMGVMNQPLIDRLNRRYKMEDAGIRLYEFLGEPFSNRTPKWKRVSQYKGFNQKTGEICRLKSYTSEIASREFYREFKENLDKLDIVYLEDCLPYIQSMDSSIYDDTDSPRKKAIQAAFPKLNEAHQITIELLIIQGMPSIQAFEILKEYMNPQAQTLRGKSKEEYFASLTKVEKQSRVSYLKGQALSVLNELVREELNK